MEYGDESLCSVADIDPASLFREMPCGAALVEVIHDENGYPLDYITRDVNSVFERIMEGDREHFIDKSAKERLPPREFKFWLERFASLTKPHGKAHMDMFSPRMEKFLYCVVLNVKKSFLVAMFTETDATNSRDSGSSVSSV